MTVLFCGDTSYIIRRVDGRRCVTFDIDVHSDTFGSTHSGAVACDGPVRIGSEKRRDGSGHYSGKMEV